MLEFEEKCAIQALDLEMDSFSMSNIKEILRILVNDAADPIPTYNVLKG